MRRAAGDERAGDAPRESDEEGSRGKEEEEEETRRDGGKLVGHIDVTAS